MDPAGNRERKTDKDIRDQAQNIQQTASGSSTENISESKSTTAKTYKVTASTITISAPGGGPSLLPSISQALNDIKAALETLATHTHPGVGASSVATVITEKAADVGKTNTGLITLQK